MWVTKLLISQVKKRIFCPKTTKFGIFGQFGPCRLVRCPVGWWLWRAGCISQDTYLLYFSCCCFSCCSCFFLFSFFLMLLLLYNSTCTEHARNNGSWLFMFQARPLTLPVRHNWHLLWTVCFISEICQKKIYTR